MKLSALAQTRHAVKAYAPDRAVPQEAIDELLNLLRFSPSSVNSQPWHFVVAATGEGRARVALGVQAASYAYNAPKIVQASHVIVLCARTDLDAAYLDLLLDREQADGRFRDAAARAAQQKARQGYTDLHRYEQKDLQHWMEKQVYLALGTLLLGAATLGLDATPMEGFDPRSLDQALELRPRGLTSVVLLALGYRSDADFNAALPKSRLPAETIFSFI